ncbi:MAG: hypothetical protein ACQETB_07040 [Halobacteriota archaeon]
MNLDELRSVQGTERQKDSLQHLRDDFYEEVATYITDLKSARDRRADAVDEPFADAEVRRITDEIETAEDNAKALYERRVGKVVKLASFAAADMPVDEEGMASHERELFGDLVDRIQRNKASVLDVLSNGGPSDSQSPSQRQQSPRSADESNRTDGSDATETPANGTDGEQAAAAGDEATPNQSQTDGTLIEAMGDGPDERGSHTPIEPDPAPDGVPPEQPVASDQDRPNVPDGGTHTQGGETHTQDDRTHTQDDRTHTQDDGTHAQDGRIERTTVKITDAVGSILGVDEREYDLRPEDVVQLPSVNAKPLLDRDAAELLE